MYQIEKKFSIFQYLNSYLNFQKITFQVLDTKEVVRRCMLHEERAYRIQIDRLLRQRNLINAALENQTCEKMSSLNL